MSTDIADIMKHHGGYASMDELKKAGLHTREIRRALENGFIIKIKPGLYKLKHFDQWDEHESFVDIHQANSKAVVCLSSALAYHELSTFNPSKVTVAVPHNTVRFELNTPPIDVFFFRTNMYQSGIEQRDKPYGSFKVYNKPKTVCDMFRFRNKLGEDLALEGLKNYLALPEANLNELQNYMKICRVKTVMKPYLKALVS